MEAAGRQPTEERRLLMSRKIRSTVVALVLASLVVPAAFAQNRSPAVRLPARTAGAVWEWLVGVFVPSVPVGLRERGSWPRRGARWIPMELRSCQRISSGIDNGCGESDGPEWHQIA